jgi:hypothetical protein
MTKMHFNVSTFDFSIALAWNVLPRLAIREIIPDL